MENYIKTLFDKTANKYKAVRDRLVAAEHNGWLSFYELDLNEEQVIRHITTLPIDNKTKREFVALYKTSYQIGEKDYEVKHIMMKTDENTTMGEIYNHFQKYSRDDENHKLEITIVEL